MEQVQGMSATCGGPRAPSLHPSFHPSAPPQWPRAHHIPTPCLVLGSLRSPRSLPFPTLEMGGRPGCSDPRWKEENRQDSLDCRTDASNVLPETIKLSFSLPPLLQVLVLEPPLEHSSASPSLPAGTLRPPRVFWVPSTSLGPMTVSHSRLCGIGPVPGAPPSNQCIRKG